LTKESPFCVYVVSDSTGRTAELVMNAVLAQFPDTIPKIKKFPNVQKKEEVSRILNEVKDEKGIVIYSFVVKELRSLIQREGKKRGLILFDLLGPLIGKLHSTLNLIPVLKPGLLKHPYEEDLRLAEAIHFTLKHDDGLGMETIQDADLIIFGVSRTLKTPSSIYLSCTNGLKVANIPIIPNSDIPKELHHIKIRKAGFTIDPERLCSIRKKRIKKLPAYTDLKSIYKELEYCDHVFRRIYGIQIIDVTNLSIEEIASKIIE